MSINDWYHRNDLIFTGDITLYYREFTKSIKSLSSVISLINNEFGIENFFLIGGAAAWCIAQEKNISIPKNLKPFSDIDICVTENDFNLIKQRHNVNLTENKNLLNGHFKNGTKIQIKNLGKYNMCQILQTFDLNIVQCYVHVWKSKILTFAATDSCWDFQKLEIKIMDVLSPARIVKYLNRYPHLQITLNIEQLKMIMNATGNGVMAGALSFPDSFPQEFDSDLVQSQSEDKLNKTTQKEILKRFQKIDMD